LDNTFEIPLTYKSKDINFPAEYISSGYSYKINVDVFGQIISFEPDEERNFRALISYDMLGDRDAIDKELIEEIAHQLIILFKD
jgi:hypothetical protein